MQLLASTLLLTIGAAHVQAQTSATDAKAGGSAAPTARIRGVVFDSLLMLPLKGASVTLLGRSETVTSDERGRFSFDDVPIGAQTIAFDAAEFDSLGLGTMGTTVTLLANETRNISIGPPSLRTLWQRRCAKPIGPDSGIVWGTIRDARSDKLLAGAVAAFSWYDMRGGPAPGIYLSDIRREMLTDDAGLYFACGVPTGMVITSAAIDTSTARGKAASGFIAYGVGSRRLQRLDLTVSPDMIAPIGVNLRTAQDSAAAARARGRATLKGIVRDDRNQPVANATVTITSADTNVVTSENGTFVVGGLPAGSHTIQTRRVGFAPVNQMVALRTDSVTDVEIISSAATVLTTYNVRTDAVKGADRAGFDLRRKMGLGAYAETKDFERRTDIGSALGQFAGLRVEHVGMSTRITAAGAYGGRCVPGVFLDGMYSNFETVSMLRPTDFKAIEVYARANTAPPEYATFTQCGVILFWSKSARWQ